MAIKKTTDEVVTGEKDLPESSGFVRQLFRRKSFKPIMELANTLRSIRIDQRMTQKEFAEQCGVNPGHVARWELGLLVPSATTLGKILAAVDQGEFDYLITPIIQLYARDLHDCVMDSYRQARKERGKK